MNSEEPKSAANNRGFNISLADIAKYDWESVITDAEHPICWEYFPLLFKKSRELGEAGDKSGESVFRFLGSVASLALREEEDQPTFAPYAVMQSGRTTALEDLCPADLDTLAGLLATTHNAAMAARFGDILWVTRKDSKAAKIAAEKYLENFKALDVAKDWVDGIESLRRGFDLARYLGVKNKPFPSYVTHVEGLIASRAKIEMEALTARLMDLLLQHESGDNTRHAAAAEQIATNIETVGNFFLAQRYFELARQFYLVAKNEIAAQKVRLKKGECYVRQARSVIAKPGQGYSTGSHFLAKGIECLRQAQAPPATIQALHEELLEWQQKMLKEVRSYEHTTDIGAVVEASQRYVRGKDLQEAVMTFALGHAFADPSQIRKTVMENAKKFPLAYLMGATFLSSDGRVLAKKPAVINAGKDADELGIEAEMFSHARNVNWPFRVSAYIEPCRLEIYETHRPSARELAFLVEDNPFIPPGHEALFLRGIHAGFRGDMMLCAHLLVPQLEEAIRHVMRRSGVITSKLDSELVQQERLLGTLLAMPQAIQLFGENCIFELRGVFCEKFGFDLRNRLAHGFLTTAECFGADVYVAWWIMLRLCASQVHRRSERRNQRKK